MTTSGTQANLSAPTAPYSYRIEAIQWQRWMRELRASLRWIRHLRSTGRSLDAEDAERRLDMARYEHRGLQRSITWLRGRPGASFDDVD